MTRAPSRRPARARSSRRRGGSSRCAREREPLRGARTRARRGARAAAGRVSRGARRGATASTSSPSASGGRRRAACCAPTTIRWRSRAATQRAGAAAISVLTEPTFFDGALEHLAAVRAAVDDAAAAQGLHRRRVPAARGAGGRRRRGAADRRGARRRASCERCRGAAARSGWTRWSKCTTPRSCDRALDAGARDHRRQQPQPADAGGRRRRVGAR